jgi:hypothetical protein
MTFHNIGHLLTQPEKPVEKDKRMDGYLSSENVMNKAKRKSL